MPILYHYTTIEGLKGIVESKSIWATSYRYLNDTEEIRHGLKIIKEYVDSELRRAYTKNAKASLRFASGILYDYIDSRLDFHFFVSSFSSAPDLLSQWRGYCPKSDGVCIGFSFDEQTLATLNKNHVSLANCEYIDNPADLPPNLTNSIKHSIEVFLQQIRDKTKQMNDLVQNFEETLIRTAISIKHPSFAEEKEARLICGPTEMEDDSVFFRAVHQTLIPYKKIELTSGGGEPVPIAGVIVGPSPKMKLSIGSIQAFLNKNGAKVKMECLEDSPFDTHLDISPQTKLPPRVIGSKIPFENW